jgi:hypothetical protein
LDLQSAFSTARKIPRCVDQGSSGGELTYPRQAPQRPEKEETMANRRQFIKYSGLTGFALYADSKLGWVRKAFAESS